MGGSGAAGGVQKRGVKGDVYRISEVLVRLYDKKYFLYAKTPLVFSRGGSQPQPCRSCPAEPGHGQDLGGWGTADRGAPGWGGVSVEP